MPRQYLRFDDLKQQQIVRNRTTLSRWINQMDFPAGILLGPRTRVWPDDEVEAWLQRRRAAEGATETGRKTMCADLTGLPPNHPYCWPGSWNPMPAAAETGATQVGAGSNVVFTMCRHERF